MEIDLRHLRHVLAVAENGNFSRAAQALHLTQPALSRSIQALESALGAPVFERGRSGVELTEVGNVVLRHARATHLAGCDLLHEVALLQGLERGELRIGAGPYGGAALVGPVVGRLNRLHPRLRISVIVAPWLELPARLLSRTLDLMVGELSAVASLEEFETLPLSQGRPVVVCRRGHPLLEVAAPTAREVLSFPLAGPRMPEHTQQALAAANRGPQGSGAATPTLTIECDSHAVLKDVLRESDAVSMMPWFMAHADIAAGLIDMLPGVDLGVTTHFGACWIRQRKPTAAGNRFLQLLREHDTNMAALHPGAMGIGMRQSPDPPAALASEDLRVR